MVGAIIAPPMYTLLLYMGKRSNSRYEAHRAILTENGKMSQIS